MYRFTEAGAILRESDGSHIPCDPLNRDYRKIMEEGAEIAPYVAPERGPKELTLPQLTDLVEYLMSGEPQIREVEKIVERVVEAPAAVVESEAPEPYTPDFTLIPDALASFAQADESATEFRARLKRLWQRFGIADGEHFPGGGEALTGEEKITMREIDIVLNSDDGKNAGLLAWMLAEERP